MNGIWVELIYGSDNGLCLDEAVNCFLEKLSFGDGEAGHVLIDIKYAPANKECYASAMIIYKGVKVV